MASPGSALESPKRKVITLKKGKKTDENPSGIVIDPYTFHVSKDNNEEVAWVADAGVKFSVNFDFDEGSPFYETLFGDEAPVSGLVRRDVICSPTRFRYIVTIDGDTHNSPDGQVDP